MLDEVEISYATFNRDGSETEDEFVSRMQQMYTAEGYWSSKKADKQGVIYKGSNCAWRKCHIISQAVEAEKCHFFIETGTFLGDTLMAVSPNFKYNWSMEAQNHFFQLSSLRFAHPTRKNVTLLEGDSPDVLPNVFSELDVRPEDNKRSIIFFDAHFSGHIAGESDADHLSYKSKKYGECPLLQEIEAISNHSVDDHVIVIDDMRVLGSRGWPTSTELFEAILNINSNYKFIYFIEIDVIIATTNIEGWSN